MWDLTLIEEHPKQAMERLSTAMQLRRGPIDDLEDGLIYENPYFRMTNDAFAFQTPGGARFRYDLGGTVRLDSPSNDLEAECRLYQWGTVYGVVAWMNGLTPLHASCMADGKRAIAFTAESGVGKSTLAASLASSGWQMVSDDTLVLVRNNGVFHALPDAKHAKLSTQTASALQLSVGEPVPFSSGKSYVELPRCEPRPIPIRDLVLLEDGPEWEFASVTGADKLELIGSSFYRGFVHSALHSVEEHSQLMLRLAADLNCWRLKRPRDPANLRDMGAVAAKLIISHKGWKSPEM